MGLDITFYTKLKHQTAYNSSDLRYFRKVYFLITYFNVEDDDNCVPIKLIKEKIEEFYEDMRKELATDHGEILPKISENRIVRPNNERFFTKEHGWLSDYDGLYWSDFRQTYIFISNLLKHNLVDWDNEDLYMCCWW